MVESMGMLEGEGELMGLTYADAWLGVFVLLIVVGLDWVG